MEILKIGDKIEINGYKSIILTDDMKENIENFAEANGLENAEAEFILNSNPAINNFIENFSSFDTDDDNYVITDFDLDNNIFKDDNILEINNSNNISNISNIKKTLANKTTATNPSTSTQPVHAPSSTDNNNNIKDLLGIFGFSAATEIKSENLIKEGNKIVGFTLNNITYKVLLDNKGIITEARTIDEHNQILSRKAYPEDPYEQYKIDLEDSRQNVLNTIMPYISQKKYNFSDNDVKAISDMLDKCIDEYLGPNGTGIFSNYFKNRLAIKLGYNVSALDKVMEDFSTESQYITDKFNKLVNVLDTGKAITKEEEKYNTEIKEVNGVNFKIKYLKSEGENPCQITSINDETILINGKNCTVNVLGLGNLGKNLQVNGSNIVLNCNSATFDNITNTSKNSEINGSFGDDIILNDNGASGTVINAGDGDDEITNKANDVTINAQDGNDTIINYGRATVDDGNGEDVINYEEGKKPVIHSSDKIYTENILPKTTPEEGDNPSDDPEYAYAKIFNVCGITFKVYSQVNDFSSVTTSEYKHLLKINANGVKIKVLNKSYDDNRIKLEGDTLKFESNVALQSVFNYADNSTLKGSNGADGLYNYADNVSVLGLDGEDRLVNEGQNVNIDGGNGKDYIYNRSNDFNVTINYDPKDKINSSTYIYPSLNIDKGSMSDKDYNLAVTFAYLEHALNHSNVSIHSELSQTEQNNISELISLLYALPEGYVQSLGSAPYSGCQFTDAALKLIEYAKNKNSANTNKTNFELLKIALTEVDNSNNGLISQSELNNFVKNLNSGSTTPDTPDTPVPTDVTAELNEVSTTIKSVINLTNTQMDAFINIHKSNADALKTLKQISTIIEQCSSISQDLIDNIYFMMTDDNFDFNNEILQDAQMVIDAQNSDNYDEYIKNHMVLDGSKLSNVQILAQTNTGDLVEKSDGKLYVNDGGTLKQLNISSETYISLFPPIGRYFVEQNDYEDCFFLATSVIEGMENPSARAKILQMFSEDDRGNITVKFPNVDYPVTFYNGQLKATDGKWSQTEKNKTISYDWNIANRESKPVTTQAKGISMLEQAYALAKFAELSNANLTSTMLETIANVYSQELADAVDDAKITNTNTLDMDKALLFYYLGGYDDEVYTDLYGETTREHVSLENKTYSQNSATLQAAYSNTLNTKSVITTRILGAVPKNIAQEYNLGGGHQYSIEQIDTVNKTVYVKNPWASYMVTAIPYDVFFAYFSDIYYRTI